MSKCKHKNIKLTEIARTELSWFIEQGKAWGSNQEPGGISNDLYVQCGDCGLDKQYSRTTAPKWLQDYLEYINSGNASEDIWAFEKELERQRSARFR